MGSTSTTLVNHLSRFTLGQWAEVSGLWRCFIDATLLPLLEEASHLNSLLPKSNFGMTVRKKVALLNLLNFSY